MATVLSDRDIQDRLSQLPDWSLSGNTITCTRIFQDFVAAVEFVNQLVEPAETAAHHPDLTISYNRVVISLTTHDAGGLTEKDFALAAIVSGLG